MTSGFVSVFRNYLGLQIHFHVSVPVPCGHISEIFYVRVDFGSEVFSRRVHVEISGLFVVSLSYRAEAVMDQHARVNVGSEP